MSALAEQLQQLKIQKEQIRQQELLLQKEMEEEEKDRISKLDAKIMPNNIHIIHHQIKKDFQKELNNMIKLQSDGVLYGDELKTVREKLRKKEIDIREKNGYNTGRNRNGYLVLNENEKFITLTEFLDNINKVDDETKEHFSKPSGNNKKDLIEIQPKECMTYFRTIMGIMKKQHQEINQLKSIIASQ